MLAGGRVSWGLGVELAGEEDWLIDVDGEELAAEWPNMRLTFHHYHHFSYSDFYSRASLELTSGEVVGLMWLDFTGLDHGIQIV